MAQTTGFDHLIGRLALEAIHGVKPLLPNADYSQDVAVVAFLIDDLRRQLAATAAANAGLTRRLDTALDLVKVKNSQLDAMRGRAEAAERPSITCPACGSVSYNPNDIRERYCGACHQWHADLPGGD